MDAFKLAKDQYGSRKIIRGRGAIYIGDSAQLPDLLLPIEQPAQTRWNVGGSEVRKTLWHNGVRLRAGSDYLINLPFLDFLLSVTLDPSEDELILTL